MSTSLMIDHLGNLLQTQQAKASILSIIRDDCPRLINQWTINTCHVTDACLGPNMTSNA